MKRVLLLMDHKENRRILADWLATRYLILPEDADQAVDQQYDLAMLDGKALSRLADVIQVRKKREEPVFLPFVLVTARHDVGLVTQHLWKSIDEVIHSPIDKMEVQARIEVLLRVRRQTVDLQDATRLRLAEQVRNAAFLESAPDAIITIDAEGKVVEFNPAAESVFGYSRAAAMGRQMAELIIPPSLRDRHYRGIANYIATGEGPVLNKRIEMTAMRADGSEFPVELAIARISTDGPLLFTGHILDITERKRADEKLRQAGERIHSVVNHVVDGIITFDEHGLVESFNPAAEKIFGYKESEVFAQNVKMLMPESYHGQHDGYLGDSPHAGHAKTIGGGREGVGRRKDGTTFPMELAVSDFRVGPRRYFTGIVRDITDRKRLERELRQRVQELAEADRRKDEFLAMLAHELRNPLAPICNGLHILTMPGTTTATIEHTRHVMELQIRHLVRLVDDLLDVSRITRGKIALVKEQVDLAVLFAQAVETARPDLDAHGHKLSVSLPLEPLRLEGDLHRLAQVLGNLLNNAAKYTERAGQIWLTGSLEGDQVVVRVRDNGIGIPPECVLHIFDLFVQADRSLQRSQGGLGIGLTVVRTLVEMHDGTVTAHSAGPGMGSEFVVRLPARLGRPLQPAKEGTDQPPLPSLSRRILVVDDNVAAADMLAVLMRLWGHEVCLAHNGRDALVVAAEIQPDLVLLDIGLPLMNGYEVARRLRRQLGLDRTTLVAVTGYGQEKDRRRSQEAGFDHHLTKPVDADSLQALVAGSPRACLSRHARHCSDNATVQRLDRDFGAFPDALGPGDNRIHPISRDGDIN